MDGCHYTVLIMPLLDLQEISYAFGRQPVVDRLSFRLAAGSIGEKLDLPPATLSFHLAGLTRAGLADSRQDGRFVIYSANFPNMNLLVDYLTENCCGGNSCEISPGGKNEKAPRARRRA